jgi:uncharacterized protein (DUF362 family)
VDSHEIYVIMMNTVAFLECRDNFEETFEKAIGLLGGLGDFGSPLVVKPNICTGNDYTGCANVKVEVIEVLVSEIQKTNRKTEIRIVESDSMSKYADEAFERYGYKTFVDKMSAQGLNISLINLTRSPLTQINFDGYYFKQPQLPNAIADVSDFISVALAKTHSLTWITGALKNMFGLLPKKDQGYYHPDIHEVILDLNSMFRSRLCLIDGRIGSEGVISGNPKNLGCLILGTNPVSVDATMARAMGFNPKKIRHIVEAANHGLGSLDPIVVGDDLDSHMVEFSKPKGLKKNAKV